MPREPVVFFLDRCLGRSMATALRAAGIEVVVHDDQFAPDAPDVEWLREVGRRGWVVLTKDTRIRFRTNEKETLFNAGVRAFVLTSGNLRSADMAQICINNLPKMDRLLRVTPAPFIAKVTRSGVELYETGRRR